MTPFVFDFYLAAHTAHLKEEQKLFSNQHGDASASNSVSVSVSVPSLDLDKPWDRRTLLVHELHSTIAREHGTAHLETLAKLRLFTHMKVTHDSMKIRKGTLCKPQGQDVMRRSNVAEAQALTKAKAAEKAMNEDVVLTSFSESIQHADPEPPPRVYGQEELQLQEAECESDAAEITLGYFCNFAQQYPCLLDPLLELQVSLCLCVLNVIYLQYSILICL